VQHIRLGECDVLLEGRVAVITGSAGGLGAAIARRFSEHGAATVLTDVRHEAGVATAATIDRAKYLPLDVTDEAAWKRVVNEVVETYGRLDVLVNNAAILHMGTIAHTPAETFRRVMDVNATGAFLGIQAAIGAMTASGGGSIVNISSVDGILPLNGLSAYVSSKWAMRGLTKSAALELGRLGIRVNCLCPSGGNEAMPAPWSEHLAAHRDELNAYMQSRGIPDGAPLEDSANAALYLASDLARNVSGVDLPVDGGHTAGTYLAAFEI
jgi:3alpha(or 20beta)-hydroxysteroid dehydrogenase